MPEVSRAARGQETSDSMRARASRINARFDEGVYAMGREPDDEVAGFALGRRDDLAGASQARQTHHARPRDRPALYHRFSGHPEVADRARVEPDDYELPG